MSFFVCAVQYNIIASMKTLNERVRELFSILCWSFSRHKYFSSERDRPIESVGAISLAFLNFLSFFIREKMYETVPVGLSR